MEIPIIEVSTNKITKTTFNRFASNCVKGFVYPPSPEFEIIDGLIGYLTYIIFGPKLTNSFLHIAKQADEVIGISAIVIENGQCSESALLVDPSYRTLGIGTDLLHGRHMTMLQNNILTYKPQLNPNSTSMYNKIGIIVGQNGYIDVVQAMQAIDLYLHPS